MGLFARDRNSGRVSIPGHEDQWMVFVGLPGRKLEKAKYAKLDSAVDAAGGAQSFKERVSLFMDRNKGDDVKKKTRERTVEEFDHPALMALGVGEWSFTQDDTATAIPINAENCDELPLDVQRWAAEQILELNGVVGKEASAGNA